MVALGQHFLDVNKAWAGLRPRVVGRPVLPLMEVAWCTNPWLGHDLDTALRRLADGCDLLWDAGWQPRPYLRVDFRGGANGVGQVTLPRTFDPGTREWRDYHDECERAMHWWSGSQGARLNLCVGNEWRLPEEGALDVAVVAAHVTHQVTRRDARNLPVSIFAPAAAPWFGGITRNGVWFEGNVTDPADFYPGPSSPWKNQCYGLARRCRSVLDPRRGDGYLLHAYSRETATFGAREPRTDYVGSMNDQRGFRVYRDALNAISTGDGRSAVFCVSETNSRTHPEQPSSATYVDGLLTSMVRELHDVPRIRDLLWYVGRKGGGIDQDGDSLQARQGHMWLADDEFNRLIANNPVDR